MPAQTNAQRVGAHMSKKKETAEAPAQEQLNGEAPEAVASASNASPVESTEPAAASEATTPEIQEPSAPTGSELQAAPDDLTAYSLPEGAIVGEVTGVGSPEVLPPAFDPEFVGLDLSTSEDVTITGLVLTAAPAPEKVTVRLLYAFAGIPAGKAVTLSAEQAATLVDQGDADPHPEAVQYALAQGAAIEYAPE